MHTKEEIEEQAYYLWQRFSHLDESARFYCMTELLLNEKQKSYEDGESQMVDEILKVMIDGIKKDLNIKWWQFWKMF